ncbi:hypothetical protein G7K_1315-t1 [Saitoella complicata NRRL Y-17804]|uniref:Uncharacterized protein n=1 Tax=Saitoella complicata (strain BCRC 22490 / CBS 7301 / JCM 7358 / NBRC 10748 / NRRL Y-17804) TaxID=698492 RepID=A0A0E9NBC3_SAICN|nr:hypothetical protein G7K_1315-t1 [Saitoella complicata NRRL Y-17804]
MAELGRIGAHPAYESNSVVEGGNFPAQRPFFLILPFRPVTNIKANTSKFVTCTSQNPEKTVRGETQEVNSTHVNLMITNCTKYYPHTHTSQACGGIASIMPADALPPMRLPNDLNKSFDPLTPGKKETNMVAKVYRLTCGETPT